MFYLSSVAYIPLIELMSIVLILKRKLFISNIVLVFSGEMDEYHEGDRNDLRLFLSFFHSFT